MVGGEGFERDCVSCGKLSTVLIGLRGSLVEGMIVRVPRSS